MNANYLSTGTGRYVHLFPLLMILPGLIVCFACAGIARGHWDFLGLLIIVAFASLLLGGLLGFLFGIPKLNRNYNPREDYDRSTKYMPNTNLEDVSDWLTKIIIGITLTQLGKIPGYLQNTVDYLIVNSNGLMLQVGFARPLLMALIIYFFIAGFIVGYFYTRIYLPNLFSIMEENRIKKVEVNLWREGMWRKGITGMEEWDAKGILASLSSDEKELLKKIKSAGNRLGSQSIIGINEQAAVRVLLTKGIILSERENAFEERYTLFIDNAIFPALNELI